MERPVSSLPTGQQDSESPFKGKTGLTRVVNAFFYSLSGFRAAFRHEDAFRQETIAAMLLVPLAFVLEDGGVGRAMMIGAVLLVLIVELLNSAIEAVVDKASPEYDRLAKRAKDMGSAAVFIALANVPLVWLLILLD
jgi:diacylglycerol kinase (ATP)